MLWQVNHITSQTFPTADTPPKNQAPILQPFCNSTSTYFSTKSEKQKKKQNKCNINKHKKKHRNHSKFKVIAPKTIKKYGFSYVNLSRLSAF